MSILATCYGADIEALADLDAGPWAMSGQALADFTARQWTAAATALGFFDPLRHALAAVRGADAVTLRRRAR